MVRNIHILLLSFPAKGAINPSLQFANNLLGLGVTKVTFLTTISAGRHLAGTLTLEGLSISTFSDGYDDGLKARDPKGFADFILQFKNRGIQALTEIIENSANLGCPISHIIYSINNTWVAEVARGFSIRATPLWIQPAAVLDIFYYYYNGYGDIIGKMKDDPMLSLQLPGIPKITKRDLPSILADPTAAMSGVLLSAFETQIDVLESNQENPENTVLVNTFDALEHEALRAIKKYNVVAIGPLVPSLTATNSEDYIKWLDTKPESSVIYVSYGTIAELSERQVKEIGEGLLKINRPFLWASKGMEKEMEPSCVEELGKLGLIVPWCSQVEVLGHPSVGCFVSHCGWNSMLESLVCGVPMVGMPQFIDQPTNAKLLEDKFGSGVRAVADGEGVVGAEEIKMCVGIVMGGGEIRLNAKKWKDLAKDATIEGGSSNVNLKAFLDEILESCN